MRGPIITRCCCCTNWLLTTENSSNMWISTWNTALISYSRGKLILVFLSFTFCSALLKCLFFVWDDWNWTCSQVTWIHWKSSSHSLHRESRKLTCVQVSAESTETEWVLVLKNIYYTYYFFARAIAYICVWVIDIISAPRPALTLSAACSEYRYSRLGGTRVPRILAYFGIEAGKVTSKRCLRAFCSI